MVVGSLSGIHDGPRRPAPTLTAWSAKEATPAPPPAPAGIGPTRSEEHTSELQSLMRISYAVFCLKKKKNISETQRHRRQVPQQQNHKQIVQKKNQYRTQ